MTQNTVYPSVNFRMAVVDLCEVMEKSEQDVLGRLYNLLDRFNDNFINRKNTPLWFISDSYKLDHTSALSYIYGIKEGVMEWDVGVDFVYDGPLPKPIQFEKFCLSLQDFLLLLSPMIDKEDLETLRRKWRYGVDYDQERIDSQATKTTLKIIPIIKPQRKDDWFNAIYDTIKALETVNGCTPSEAELWRTLIKDPPASYGIEYDKTKKALNLSDLSPLDRENLRKRYGRYYPSNPH